MASNNKTFHIYECGGECVSAESPDDAAAVYLETMGATAQETLGEPSAQWTLVPDDKPVTTVDEDIGGNRTTKTASTWAAEFGRGFAWSNNI